MNALTELTRDYTDLHGYPDTAAELAAQEALQVELALKRERQEYILRAQAAAMDWMFEKLLGKPLP